MDDKKSKYKLFRILFVISWFIFFGLGTTGMFLPILPTVPFYLLSVYCFSRGSTKYERWLRGTTVFKKRVYFFDKYKVMTFWSMFSILIFVSGILAVTCFLTDKIIVSVVLPLASACQYLYFIIKVKPVTRAEMKRLAAFDKELTAGASNDQTVSLSSAQGPGSPQGETGS